MLTAGREVVVLVVLAASTAVSQDAASDEPAVNATTSSVAVVTTRTAPQCSQPGESCWDTLCCEQPTHAPVYGCMKRDGRPFAQCRAKYGCAPMPPPPANTGRVLRVSRVSLHPRR
jgi:hypothetical protein